MPPEDTAGARRPLAFLTLAVAVVLLAGWCLRTAPVRYAPPRTSAEAVDRAFPLLRALIGEMLWIQLVQDIPSDNDYGATVLVSEAARFDLLVEHLPNMVEAYGFGAEVLNRWGGRSEAIRLLERGVDSTGDMWLHVQLNAERLAQRDRDYSAAIASLRRTLQLPGHPLFIERLMARCYLESGDTETARRLLTNLLTRCPEESVDRDLTRRALERLAPPR